MVPPEAGESLLDEYRPGKKPGAHAATREGRPPFSINFVRAKDAYAIPYGHLVWMNYDRSSRIQLHFSSHSVSIIGSNLDAVYQGIRSQELSEVAVTPGRPEMRPAKPSGPVVDEIRIAQPHGKPYGAGDFGGDVAADDPS